MNRYMVLTAAAVTFGAHIAVPAAAQEVIPNPGRCAQYYPNANCQNYGPGNPYRGPYSYQSRQGWRDGYAMARPHYWRHHRQGWR
jgi:hypothetical protein